MILFSVVIYIISFIITLQKAFKTTLRIQPAARTNSVTKTPPDVVDRDTSKTVKPAYAVEQEKAHTDQDAQILQTLLLGLPSPSSILWSFVTVAINIILALFVGDLVFRTPLLYSSHDLSFARVGFVSGTSANILFREPNNTQLPIFISYRYATSLEDPPRDNAWKAAGQVFWLANDTDYTHAITIPNLRPSSCYEYAISNNHAGFFCTAAPAGQKLQGTSKFTFLTSSCIKPRFPYNPLAHPLSIPGFKHLAKWLPSLQASFMLFLGDFIYIDVPLRFGTAIETYRREYRQVYSSPDWPSVSSIPWLHVLDDHEIANDWDANATAPYPAAADPWRLYHASVNPPAVHQNSSYFSFTQGPASFFLLDTRRYRTPEFSAPPSSPSKSMLGPLQLTALLAFLARPEPPGVKWKFIISSIPFTRNWRFGSADTWAGYLHERQMVLEAMWDAGAHEIGVVVLSGDRHEFAATKFPPPKGGRWGDGAAVHEFSTSPLSMFYLPVRTYWEIEGEDDVCVKYIPDGNSKFGAVELENVGEQGLLRFRLFVDGAEAWDYVLTTPPTTVGGSRGRDAVWG